MRYSYHFDNKALRLDSRLRAEIQNCIRAHRQANSSPTDCLADITNWAGADDEDALSIAKDEMRERWPGNSGDGSPAISKPEPVFEQPKTKRVRLLKAEKTEPKKREQPFLLKWRRAVCSVSGPGSATTRFLLLALSLYASNMDGDNIYPGQQRLAGDTALGLSTVKRHIARAINGGWLRRKRRDDLHGGLGGYKYTLLLPERREGGSR